MGMGKFCRTGLFLIFLPCLLHSTRSSSSLEPILVESCVDSETGDCTAGKANCNLRAAVALCIDIAPPVCNILIPFGTHNMIYGAINITTNISTAIFISSSESVGDPCYNAHKENSNQAIIDGSGQTDRFLNVHTGSYVELSELEIRDFGHANLNMGGAVFNTGGFIALDVNFYGNQAIYGSVAFNGEWDSSLEPHLVNESFDESFHDILDHHRIHHRIITSTKSTLYVQHSTCALSASTNDSKPLDLFSASGQAYLECSPSCTIGGIVQSSVTCAPTQAPTSLPTITEQPTSYPRSDDDDAEGDDFFGDISSGFTAPVVAVLLAVILCLMISCLLGGKGLASTNTTRKELSVSLETDSKEFLDNQYPANNLNSSILESMYKHFGVETGGGGGGGGGSVNEGNPLSEPFLQAALESMEGKPGDWIVDVRALDLGPMIGVGSSAHVFSATYFGQRVAAKRLPALTWKPEEVETFLRHEAGLLVHLHHPSVIKFYGVGISGDYVYMVTELCCGSLTNLIDRANAHPGVEQAALEASQKYRSEHGSNDDLKEKAVVSEAAATAAAMPLDLLISLALGVAQGVEFLHSRGVVHRDLKPDNVLLTESNEVKLCDFGISRMEHDRSGMTTAVGTPLLMAPELVMSETASLVSTDATAVDVFSFGILLWMISTQHLCPYDGVENPWLLLSQVTQGRRPLLAITESSEGIKLRGTNLMRMPQQFRDLIASCWHSEPSARPTFSMITEELEILMDQMVDEQIQIQQQAQEEH